MVKQLKDQESSWSSFGNPVVIKNMASESDCLDSNPCFAALVADEFRNGKISFPSLHLPVHDGDRHIPCLNMKKMWEVRVEFCPPSKRC